MIDNRCKVSIITVVYNGIKTIEHTILSVLGQTYNNIEYIIIDGKSTDGTQQIIEKYKNSIAYYVSEKDKGLYDAMNKGIQRATGEIIGIINSDDWYENNTVEKVIGYFGEYNVDLVYGKAVLVYPDGKQKMEHILPLETLWYQTSVSHPTVFVKKEVYEKFGCFNLKYEIAADYDFLLRLYSQHVEFGFIDSVLTYFRVGGISEKKGVQSFKESLVISRKYIETYSKRREEMLEKLEEVKKADWFYLMLKKEKELLPELLYRYFHEELSELMIFGTGVWGENCYEVLKDGKTKIVSFIDNDLSKKEQLFHNIKIIVPQKIAKKQVYILIAVRNGAEKIKEQLESLGNGDMKYVDLNDLMIMYYQNNRI